MLWLQTTLVYDPKVSVGPKSRYNVTGLSAQGLTGLKSMCQLAVISSGVWHPLPRSQVLTVVEGGSPAPFLNNLPTKVALNH